MNDRRTILFVDDHEGLRNSVCEFLLAKGYRPMSAHDADSALRILKLSPDPIDVLIADVLMPAMTGWDLARQAKWVRPHLKVIFVSGSLVEQAMSQDIVQKPFRLNTLLNKIEELLTEG